MMGLQNGIRLTLGVGMLLVATYASAQDSLDQGKSGAQLFAANCAICHKSPEGLAKAGGLFGVQSFLREHYTASKETAAVIAAYLQSVDKAAGPGQRGAPPKRGTSGKPAGKKPDAKRGEGTPDKGSENKSSETKPAESKSSANKPAEPTAESKPSEAKPADASKSEKSE